MVLTRGHAILRKKRHPFSFSTTKIINPQQKRTNTSQCKKKYYHNFKFNLQLATAPKCKTVFTRAAYCEGLQNHRSHVPFRYAPPKRCNKSSRKSGTLLAKSGRCSWRGCCCWKNIIKTESKKGGETRSEADRFEFLQV